jgi:hypothetical protein
VSSDLVLSPAAERFMSRHVDSVGTLDLLALLHAERGRDWGLAELCAELRCPSAWATRQVGRLAMLGLVLQPEPGLYRLAPSSRQSVVVDEIVAAYRRDRPAVARWVPAQSPPGAVLD